MSAIQTEKGSVHLMGDDGRSVCGRLVTGVEVDRADRRVCPNCLRVEKMRAARVVAVPAAPVADGEVEALREEVRRLAGIVQDRDETIERLKAGKAALVRGANAHAEKIVSLEADIVALRMANADLRRLNTSQGEKIKAFSKVGPGVVPVAELEVQKEKNRRLMVQLAEAQARVAGGAK